jgi:hypothetical protein
MACLRLCERAEEPLYTPHHAEGAESLSTEVAPLRAAPVRMRVPDLGA